MATDTKYATVEFVLHAAFVADEKNWGVRLESTRSHITKTMTNMSAQPNHCSHGRRMDVQIYDCKCKAQMAL